MDIAQLLEKRKYDPKKAPQIEQVIFTIQDKNIGSLQNVVFLSGLPKAGKSRYIATIISSGLTGREIFTMKLRLYGNHFKLIHFDTEQSEYDYYKLMSNIKNTTGLNELPIHFSSFNMREDDPKTIISAIDYYLTNNENIGCVIIDGILDLLYTYNDEAESKKLINYLKKWSKRNDCLIICVLHTGKTTGSTVGHFGAMADRASQTSIEIKRDEIEKQAFYNLTVKQSRSCDNNDIVPVQIFYNAHTREWEQSGGQSSIQVANKKKSASQIHTDIHKTTLTRIFVMRGRELQYNELADEIRQYYCTSVLWSKEAIKYFLSIQILFKNDKGLYTIYQQLKLTS